MEIEVILPDDVAERANPGREAMERLVIEGYRSGALSHYQGSRLLAMSRLEFDAFLKAFNVDEYAYGVEDFKEDENALRRLESRSLI